MVLIPQKLFSDPRIKIIMQDGHNCVLTKRFEEALINREGYITQHVIVILKSGAQHITTYEEEEIKVKGPQVLVLPKGLYYVSDLLPKDGEAFEAVLCYFDQTIIQAFLSGITIQQIDRKQPHHFLRFGLAPEIEYFVDGLIKIYGPMTTSKTFVQLKQVELLHLLNQFTDQQMFADFLFRLILPKKRNIRQFMEQNYLKPLKVEDYAYLTGRSISSFRRDFKDQFQASPQEWIRERRLVKAKDLFDLAPRKVAAVAHEIGYENVSYFIRTFKSRFGKSPKQYVDGIHKNKVA